MTIVKEVLAELEHLGSFILVHSREIREQHGEDYVNRAERCIKFIKDMLEHTEIAEQEGE